MGHHQVEEPHLVPGMAPMLTRVLAVGGDTTRLGRLVRNLRLRGYQVTSSTDPAAAMAGLRQDGQQGFSFDVVIVGTCSEYGDGARLAANKLLGFAVREPLLCGYAIKGNAIFGPLAMEDLDKFRKPEQQQLAQNPKMSRVVWTDELHNKFVEAYDELLADGEDPVPKNILYLMEDPTHTRENIASYLQKHRLNLQRQACTDPPRRIHSRMKHYRSTPQASSPSPNMSSLQQAALTIMQPDMSATVHINYGRMNADTMLEASTKSDMQDRVIHMPTLKATDKSNRTWNQ
ncbi:hypothetical protein ACQ4PT_051036 [Festuca glaucescens]